MSSLPTPPPTSLEEQQPHPEQQEKHHYYNPSHQPLRSAMKTDDGADKMSASTSSLKAVQIAEPGVAVPDETHTRKQHVAGVAGRRLSGRPPIAPGGSPRISGLSQSSVEGGGSTAAISPLLTPEDGTRHNQHSHHWQRVDRVSEKLLAQVAEWLEHEKQKRQFRKTRVSSSKRKSPPRQAAPEPNAAQEAESYRPRAGSLDSQASDASLDRLQRILDDGMLAMGLSAVPHYSPKLGRRHKRSQRSLQLHRTASSDTEYCDGDVVVPSCDAFLDNTKAMSYVGGKAISDDVSSISSKKSGKERRGWIAFKNEIIRIAHTLRLKGWRHVPLESGQSISCERLSGALTNAVYVVSPPAEVVASTPEGRKPPTKVLLRVYGPQVEHLIDRENELSVLRRLARKKIGPRLLGTFLNGRFEQFFNATTLTPVTMRDPDTSRQIAKRMRELHDGIDLLEGEKDEGPAVWRNWDKWLQTVEKTITFLDQQILSGEAGSARGPVDAWKLRGLVCGVEWHRFRAMVEKYRRFLDKTYGSTQAIRDRLVFAHNDTQYGNILRIHPDDEKSPLLQPANKHKQLVVIDFEYAAANVRGLEFANHFTEWTYNYHDAPPYRCNTANYPTPEEQRRFLRAYIDHRPQHPRANATTSSSTPLLTPLGTPALQSTASTSSIVEFMLDARVPPGGTGTGGVEYEKTAAAQEEEADARVAELMEETRLWRIANSAQWVAWGIVQAKVPGVVDLLRKSSSAEPADQIQTEPGPSPQVNGGSTVPTADMEEDQTNADGNQTVAEAEAEQNREEYAEADEFDYLGYAQERAMFFWGDCVQMGLLKAEELPKDVRGKIKVVKY